jgi:hypothetical protein
VLKVSSNAVDLDIVVDEQQAGRSVGRRDAAFDRNLGLLAIGVGVYVGIQALTGLTLTFHGGLAVSLTVTFSALGAFLLWCSRFITRNVNAGTQYFREIDARTWRLTNSLFFGGGPALLAAAVIAHGLHAPFVSGLLVGPVCLLLLGAVGRATGGISRL